MTEATEACDPKTEQSRLITLSFSSNQEIRALVAQNPNTPIYALLSLARTFPKEVAVNPIFSLTLLETPQLIPNMDPEIAYAFALREETPEWLIELLLTHPKSEVAQLISYRANLSERLLAMLAERLDCIDKVISHPNTTEAIWSKIASKEEDPSFKGIHENNAKVFIARAPNLPDSARSILEKTPGPQLQLSLRLRDEPPNQEPLPALRYAGATDVGIVRSYNEDAFGLYQGSSLALFLVADGMGGSSTGYIAAEAVRDLLLEAAKKADLETVNAQLFLHQNFVGTFEAINKAANRGPYSSVQTVGGHVFNNYGLGATTVALLVQGHTATIAHAGDSRAYLLRGGSFSQLTEDHSLLNDYIKIKVLSPEEIENFPHKNVITRALGMGFVVSTPDLNRLLLLPGDLLLLCSDGLHGMLNDQSISQVLQEKELSVDDRAKRLIELANQAGGNDNIAVVLVEVG